MAPKTTLVATDVAWMETWAYRVCHAQSQQEANSLEGMMLKKFWPHSVLDRQGLSSPQPNLTCLHLHESIPVPTPGEVRAYILCLGRMENAFLLWLV